MHPEVTKLLRSWGYKVWQSKVNSRHHGLPQNRSRMYLVGILNDAAVSEFSFPPPVVAKELKTLLTGKGSVAAPTNKTVLDNIEWGLNELKSRGVDIDHDYAFIDVHASKSRRQAVMDMCPCLTRHRCLLHGYYLTRRKTMLDPEDVRSMNFPTNTLAEPRHVYTSVEEWARDKISAAQRWPTKYWHSVYQTNHVVGRVGRATTTTVTTDDDALRESARPKLGPQEEEWVAGAG